MLEAKKRQFTEKQIIKIFDDYNYGKSISDICRENDISPVTFYHWKVRYEGMDAAQLKRIRSMEEELSKYKTASISL